MMLYLG